MNWNERGKKRSWPNLRRNWNLRGGSSENHKTRVTVGSLQAEILTRDLRNAKLEC
jgi:hypothetical protein